MVSATVTDAARAALGGCLIAAWLLGAAPARADVPPTDKAAAEALFEHAKDLMTEGRYGDACAKFQESERIDPGIGTMLYLADCFEKNGQTASAWAEFIDAAGLAKNAGQADREKKARERAAALEAHLNRLVVTVIPGGDIPGLEVKRDGAAVMKPLWSTPVPVDPGEHEIEASAPGKKRWSTKVRIDMNNLSTVTVTVPVLEDAPEAPPSPVAAPKAEAPRADAPKAEAPRAPPRIVERPPAYTPVRVAGGTFVGLGVASAAVGAVLGAIVLQKKSDAGQNCDGNGVCGAQGTAAMNSAYDFAKGANIALIAGGGAFVVGIVMLIATRAPDADRPQIVRAAPFVVTGGGGFALGRAF